MSEKQFTTTKTAWCPGCGNFSILSSLAAVLNELQLQPKNTLLVGGIGQAAKTNQYVRANGLSGLHGRALPAAVGAKIANPNLTVIVNSGDGDSYGEGGNHFIHNIRRNVDMTHFVHNNQVYGLTTGQTSPTSESCTEAERMPCNYNTPLKPLSLALSSGATFVARSFSGDSTHLKEMMRAAILHPGYALVDILQPCVSFNKINTLQWYQERVYTLAQDSHDRTDKQQALALSMQWHDKIPIGILYQKAEPTFHQRHPHLADGKNISTLSLQDSTIDTLMQAFK